MTAADFIGLLFLARDVTHSVHLNHPQLLQTCGA